MRRSLGVLVLGLLLAATAFPTTSTAGTNAAPVSKYLAAQSVLGNYYGHFVSRYGRNYGSKEETFRAFCRVLRQSDLLSGELRAIGITQAPIHNALAKLERMDLAHEPRDLVRRMMLTVDFALESIESMIVPNHRGEFRREVLAEVPPMAHNG